MALDPYIVGLTFVGFAILGAALLPRWFEGHAISFPIVYIAAGAIIFSLPIGLIPPDPVAFSELGEHATEFLVIVALMGAGLKIDRPFSVSNWSSTWRLLAVAMPLTIAAAALLGWWVIGFAIPTAVLLGAVIAPTDPVLASEVQVGPPETEENDGVDEDEREYDVKFALTSEAGLNDGLAFPFTYLAIAMVLYGVAPQNWIWDWVLVDVAYRIVVGTVAGYLIGMTFGRFVFDSPAESALAKSLAGSVALAATLISYGLTELVEGYGFIAVFVTALVIRDYERTNEYNKALHDFANTVERLTIAGILILFGGALATSVAALITWEYVAVALVLLFVVRPFAGLVAMVGTDWSYFERLLVSFFGIRGVGSFFYLSYAINRADFAQESGIWTVVSVVVLISAVVHGVTASPTINLLERRNGG